MQMYYKNDSCVVEVYSFFEDKTCLIFSPVTATKQNGQGWQKVNVKNLIPLDFYKEYYDKNMFMSKSEKNRIKERLTLTHAVWTCTDGNDYTNCMDAIIHEKSLLEGENKLC